MILDNEDANFPDVPCNFSDPAEACGTKNEKLQIFREIRDQIKTKISEFIKMQRR